MEGVNIRRRFTIGQTERRVLRGQAVAANEKIVSPFEQHADIIVKGGREVQYGHKLNLTTGRSGLILEGRQSSGQRTVLAHA